MKTTPLDFTGQRLSPHAGSARFRSCSRPLDWVRRLTNAQEKKSVKRAVLPKQLPAGLGAS